MQRCKRFPIQGLDYKTLTKKALEIFPRHIFALIQMSEQYDVSFGNSTLIYFQRFICGKESEIQTVICNGTVKKAKNKYCLHIKNEISSKGQQIFAFKNTVVLEFTN